MVRVSYVSRAELDPDFEDFIVSSLQPGQTLNVYSALGNNQEVLRGVRAMLEALWNSSGLTDRQREVVILAVAAEMGSEYEWHQHEAIGAEAGLSSAEIAAIARDDHDPFSGDEQALIAYTRAVARGRVTDPLHAALSEYLDEETIVGAAATAAGYAALALLIDALGVEIEPGDEFVGWDPDSG